MNTNGKHTKEDSGETWRTFIAVPLPDAVRGLMSDIQSEMRRYDWPVKWVDPELAHITLKFLGDISPGSVPDIERTLEDVAGESIPLSAAPGSIGAFPGLHRARVIWLGLDGDLSPMVDMARRVDDSLVSLGFEREQRPFRPHITLGRVRRNTPPPADVEQVAQQIDTACSSVTFDRLRLVRSVLGNDGPAYTTLSEWNIGVSSGATRADAVDLVEHG